MQATLLLILSFLYLVVFIFINRYLKTLKPINLQVARVLLGSSVGFQLLLGAYEFSITTFTSDVHSHHSALAFSAFAGTILFVLCIRKKAMSVVLVCLPVLTAYLVVNHFYADMYVKSLLPSIWIWLHVTLMVLGEALFFVSGAAAFAYLLTSRQLRKKNLSFFSISSSLPTLDIFLGRVLVWGLVLLSLGVLFGSLFAEQFWGPQWWLDAKVVFVVFTLLVYLSLVLARQFLENFKGRRSAIAAMISFVLVLILSIGVDLIFDTGHDEIKSNLVDAP